MKSNETGPAISFLLLQERIVEYVLSRVNNGQYTERGLARILGVSQPQIHNVLKGKRRLQPSLADVILEKFNIDVLDLIHEHELRARLVTGAFHPLIATNPGITRKGPGKEKSDRLSRDESLG